MNGKIKPTARKDGIVVQKLEDETLVYDLKENKALCLNETSALVWELSDGTRSISQVSDELSKRFRTLIDEDFINLALEQLVKDGLLEDGSSDYLGGLSRREMIRKVGFAAVVALPVVSSIVAPNAAMAQSCGALQSICSNNGECCSGNCATFGLPQCCVPGAFNSVAPGDRSACGTPAQGQAHCDLNNHLCCSNSSTFSNSQGSCNPGFLGCICDPFP